MAIHPDFPGLKVEIAVDTKALQEHNNPDPEPSPKTVTKYIEAIDDAKFSVRLAIPGPLFEEYRAIRAAIRLDGEDMIRRIYRGPSCKRLGINSVVSSSRAYVDGVDMGQDFQFSQFGIYEATSIIDDGLRKAVASMGQVSVVFHAVHNVRRRIMENRVPSLRQYKSIPENALKGSSISHSARLGPLTEQSSAVWFECDYVHGEHHPFATFHFNYRSLAALKNLHIVPRTPSPVPLEQRPVEELDVAQLALLVTQYRAREVEAERAKRERSTTVKRERHEISDSKDHDGIIVVEERSVKRRFRTLEQSEVIVLD